MDGFEPGMEHEELANLVRRAQSGEAAAFDALIEAYGPRLYGFFYRLTASRDEAEDLLQDLFVRVVRTISRYVHADQFDGWLFRIATNLVRDRIRRRQRGPGWVSIETVDEPSRQATPGPALQDGRTATSDGIQRAEELDRLQAALGQLAPAEREVVILRHFSELSFAQIAEIMQTPLGTALARAHRGLAKLRQMLGDE